MKLSVRESEPDHIEKIVNYFLCSDTKFLRGMGVEKDKLPKKEEWMKKLESESKKSYEEKQLYYIIWQIDNRPIGHSNINNIQFKQFATMHLHLWEKDMRKNGFGSHFLQLTIPHYFKYFRLQKLICEPYSKNIAPNKTLKKLGFELVKTYNTIPGPINFRQFVNRYEMSQTQFKSIKSLDLKELSDSNLLQT